MICHPRDVLPYHTPLLTLNYAVCLMLGRKLKKKLLNIHSSSTRRENSTSTPFRNQLTCVSQPKISSYSPQFKNRDPSTITLIGSTHFLPKHGKTRGTVAWMRVDWPRNTQFFLAYNSPNSRVGKRPLTLLPECSCLEVDFKEVASSLESRTYSYKYILLLQCWHYWCQGTTTNDTQVKHSYYLQCSKATFVLSVCSRCTQNVAVAHHLRKLKV